jgi:hypothetical protein
MGRGGVRVTALRRAASLAVALAVAWLAPSPASRAADVRASDAPAGLQSRRIVDVMQSGDATSERDHDAEGDGVTEGTVAGRAFRQAAGWLRYTLRTFDDTEVTVACLCRGTEGRRVSFELLIDGQAAGTHTFESPSADPVLKQWRVPEKLTLGKTKVSVTLRGVNGPTPGVIELRTVQEHLE